MLFDLILNAVKIKKNLNNELKTARIFNLIISL